MATDYEGLISRDELYREIGSPSQDPSGDTYFPKEGLQAIITRHLQRFEKEIERKLSDQGPDQVAHLADRYTMRLPPDFATPGLAGAKLPDSVVPYIFRATLVERGENNNIETRTQLQYDNALDRLVERYAPGKGYRRIRLSGRNLEVLPNKEAALYCYLVPRSKALEGLLPEVVVDVNAAIKEEARQAVEAQVNMRKTGKRSI